MLRLAACFLLLVAEYALLGAWVDGTKIARRPGGWAAFGNVGNLVTLGATVLTAGLLTRGGRFLEECRGRLRELGPAEPRWLVAHGLAFSAFAGISLAIFEGTALDSHAPGAWVVLWALAGSASLAALLRFAAGGATWPLARALALTFGAGVVIGGATWSLAWWLRPAWPWLTSKTLPLAGALLELVDSDATVRGEVLGLDGFLVAVEPECAGAEGLIVIAALVIGYLAVQRGRLRFPNALLLLPLATLVVFTLNIVRITVLVLIGAAGAPAVALGGFHSKAGWLGVCVVALAVFALGSRARLFAREVPEANDEDNPTLAYCMPLFVVLALSMITGVAAAKVDWLYGLRAIGAGVALWYYRDAYSAWGRPHVLALVNGAVVFGLWFALASHASAGAAEQLESNLAQAPAPARALWLISRTLGSVVAIPVVEELAFRGFLQRRLIAPEFEAVPQRSFTWPSLLGSAFAFGAAHQSLLAGTIAGLAFSLAVYQRGKLIDAIVAHATANALIALTVIGFDQWWLW